MKDNRVKFHKNSHTRQRPLFSHTNSFLENKYICITSHKIPFPLNILANLPKNRSHTLATRKLTHFTSLTSPPLTFTLVSATFPIHPRVRNILQPSL